MKTLKMCPRDQGRCLFHVPGSGYYRVHHFNSWPFANKNPRKWIRQKKSTRNKKKWNWIGHTLRKPDGSVDKTSLTCGVLKESKGRRIRGKEWWRSKEKFGVSLEEPETTHRWHIFSTGVIGVKSHEVTLKLIVFISWLGNINLKIKPL